MDGWTEGRMYWIYTVHIHILLFDYYYYYYYIVDLLIH